MAELSSQERFKRAVQVVSELQFSRKVIVQTLRSVLQVYDGHWSLIEEDGYSVLVERLLSDPETGAEDSPPRAGNKRETRGEPRTPARKRLKFVKEEKASPVDDPARNSAIKLGKGNESNYLAAVRKQMREIRAKSSVPRFDISPTK